MKYTTTVLAAANLLALIEAAPVEHVCKVITMTYTGVPIWNPQPDPTGVSSWSEWPAWTTTTSKKPDASTKISSVDPWTAWTTSTKTPADTKTSSADPWTAWTTSNPIQTTTSTSAPAVTTTTIPNHNTHTSTTKVPEVTTTTTTTTTSESSTTTTAPPKSTATCPTAGGTPVLGGGSCDCSYQVNCDAHAGTDSNSKFWEQTSGALIGSLAECLSICDNNAECEAAIWTDDSTAGAQDYHRCWQVSGLQGIVGSGYGQISYRGSCSGTCSGSYNS